MTDVVRSLRRARLHRYPFDTTEFAADVSPRKIGDRGDEATRRQARGKRGPLSDVQLGASAQEQLQGTRLIATHKMAGMDDLDKWVAKVSTRT